MQKYQDVAAIIGPPGLIPVVGVNVYVYNHGTSTQATIFSDAVSTVTVNPIITDNSGRYSFYAADGRYDLTVSGAGIQTTSITDILLQSNPSTSQLLGQFASVTSVSGGSLVGIQDTSNAFVGTTVEAALSETLTQTAFASTQVALTSSSGAAVVGFIESSSATQETVQSALRRTGVWINQYGACDGVTDDTIAASTAALVAAAASTSLYYFGTPLISSTLTFDKKIDIIGIGGLGTTTLDLPSSFFIKKSTMTSTALILAHSGIIMKGGGVVGQAGNSGDNIFLSNNAVTLRDVTSVRAGQDGIRIGRDTAGLNCNSWMLDNVHTHSNVRHGLMVHSGDSNANAGTAVNLASRLNGGDGVFNNTAQLNSYIGLLAESNTGCGMHFGSSAATCLLAGGDREANGSTNTLVDAGASDIMLLVNPSEVTDNTTVGMVRPDRLTVKQGTSTLALVGSATPGTNTYSDSTCTWVRQGDMAFITGRLTVTSSDAAMAGNLQITGLPFLYPSGFTKGVAAFAIGQSGNFKLIQGYTLAAWMAPNTAAISLLQSAPNSTAQFVNATSAPNGSQIYFSGWYPIAQF